MSFNKLVFSFIGLTVILFSCKKDDNNDDGGNNTQQVSNSISAEINGTHWETAINSVAISGGTQQIFAMRNSDGSSFNIFIPQSVSTGDYQVTDSFSLVTISYSKTDQISDRYNNWISGSLKIEKNESGSLKGQFEGKFTSSFKPDTLTIKDGSYDWSKK